MKRSGSVTASGKIYKYSYLVDDPSYHYAALLLFPSTNYGCRCTSYCWHIECAQMKLTLIVRDTPRPGGSKTPGINRKTGKAFVRPANKHTATWRDSVRAAALEAYQGKPLRGAFRVDCTFYFNRPQSHYGSGKNWHVMKNSADQYHTKMPDRTKLLRSTEDALTGIIWVDDAQVVEGAINKCYAGPNDFEGVVLTIVTLEDEPCTKP